MKIFNRRTFSASQGVVTLSGTSHEIGGLLATMAIKPVFISGYISPHLDIDVIGKSIGTRFPGVPLMLCSTAGELCGLESSLYCSTGNTWDHVVLQCFDATLFEKVQIVPVPLGSEDLRQAAPAYSMDERLARLTQSIENIRVDFPLDHRDCFAHILFDGLSASESFFMEALYNSGRFPCWFVGGSAGGKLDFKTTAIHDGRQRFENHVLIAFIKVAKGTRFGVFKSQNFEQVGESFHVIHASPEQRFVRDVVSPSGRAVSFIESLCEFFKCQPGVLADKLADYSFAIRVGKEIYVRSVNRVDLERGVINFSATSLRARSCS